ncbi:MAG: hypothetical protein Q8933_10000 [Bacteroidota bacterium]|nr:hypothetical protein [Bacteroidota bacterium]MDP4193111.1 hypothetical protein [Bacteroidota bacterium]MDP4194627.1 hypothetical protein [Bacteroidota bacterium]
MKKYFLSLTLVLIIGFLIFGCEYKKVRKHVYIDSLFVKDSLLVFSNMIQTKSVWTGPDDTAQFHYDLEYVISLYERVQLNKVHFLLPLEKYDPLISHIRKMPVLVIVGRQYRDERTGFNLTGDFVNGKFIASDTRAVVVSFGDYLDNKNSKYKFEVIDTVPKGYVTAGMTKSMVKKALGEPLLIISDMNSSGKLEQWTYDEVFRFDGTKEKLKNRKFIYFLNERAVSIKD